MPVPGGHQGAGQKGQYDGREVSRAAMPALAVAYEAQGKVVKRDRAEQDDGSADDWKDDSRGLARLGGDVAHPERERGVDGFIAQLLDRALRLDRPGEREPRPRRPESESEPERRQHAYRVAVVHDSGQRQADAHEKE